MVELRQIPYAAIAGIKSDAKYVSFADAGVWWGLYSCDMLVAFLNVIAIGKGKEMRIRSVYTLPKHRRRGYCQWLIASVVRQYKGTRLTAHCLESSYKAFQHNGFVLDKEVYHKLFKIYAVQRVV